MENRQSVLYLTPKSSYYSKKEEVLRENVALHDNLFKEDRLLYTYLLYFTNSTYYSKSLIFERLLKNSLHKEENQHYVVADPKLIEVEDALIEYVLKNENITYVFKTLMHLKRTKVSNPRTSKIILKFIFNRTNTDYLALKYKKKIKALLYHALGQATVAKIINHDKDALIKFHKLTGIYSYPNPVEVVEFACNVNKEYKSTYFNEYIKIRQQFAEGTYKFTNTHLPIEVLMGFNNNFKTKYSSGALLSSGNISNKQKIQLQRFSKKENSNIQVLVDLNKYSIEELYKYMYNAELTFEEVMNCRNIIETKAQAIRKLIAKNFIFELDKCAIILDCSDSNAGTYESKLNPFYKNLTMASIFRNQEGDNLFLAGGHYKDALLYPSGHTDLTTPLIEVVEKGYRNILIVSDGFENVGDFNKVYSKLNDLGYGLNAVHFNPVFSPKNLSFKTLGEKVPTIPFVNEKDIDNLLLFLYLNTDKELFKTTIRKRIDSELLV